MKSVDAKAELESLLGIKNANILNSNSEIKTIKKIKSICVTAPTKLKKIKTGLQNIQEEFDPKPKIYEPKN
jgi:hypothetical protein